LAIITVIGTGYVGLVSGACLADFGNTVVCVDNDSQKIHMLEAGEIPLYEPGLDTVIHRNVEAGRLRFSLDVDTAVRHGEVLFIAVGTPPMDDGSADLKYVESVARQIGTVLDNYKVIVDKSTVPVGTGQKVKKWIKEEINRRVTSGDNSGGDICFDVVSNPEFLREGSAVQDFMHPDRVVIGAETGTARNVMKEVYRSLYLNDTPFVETDIETAEMIKYASNAFLAVKITFINEVANLCEKVGANIQDVAKAMGKDGRIGGKFLHAGPGYGGSCFPKDTQALARIARDAGSQLSLIETTINANERQKQNMIIKIEQGMGGTGSLKGKTIAILGLAFKPNTDDMREAPSIVIIQGLVERGAIIRACDPAALHEAAWRLNNVCDAVSFYTDEYEAINGADCVVIMTEWNQYRNLDFDKVKCLVKHPFLFDLRNVYTRKDMELIGFNYFGVGQ
jgi:UDPglucose 6-dehydrogenase